MDMNAKGAKLLQHGTLRFMNLPEHGGLRRTDRVVTAYIRTKTLINKVLEYCAFSHNKNYRSLDLIRQQIMKDSSNKHRICIK